MMALLKTHEPDKIKESLNRHTWQRQRPNLPARAERVSYISEEGGGTETILFRTIMLLPRGQSTTKKGPKRDDEDK